MNLEGEPSILSPRRTITEIISNLLNTNSNNVFGEGWAPKGACLTNKKQNFMQINVRVDKISQFLALLDNYEPIVVSRTTTCYEVHVRPVVMTKEFSESIEGMLVFEEEDYLMDCPFNDNNVDL